MKEVKSDLNCILTGLMFPEWDWEVPDDMILIPDLETRGVILGVVVNNSLAINVYRSFYVK